MTNAKGMRAHAPKLGRSQSADVPYPMLSYNCICVPLDNGMWSCELVAANDYRSPSGQSLPFIKGNELRQLDEDRRTFERHFHPRYDFRRTITADIDAVRSFMRDHLRVVSQWDIPKNNAGIERLLKQAVTDKRIVPVVDHDRRTPVNTADTLHAPQSWGPTYRSGGGGTVIASSSGKSFHQMAMESMGLTAEGAWAYIERYNAMVERINAAEDAWAVARDSTGGLPGAAATALGGAVHSANNGTVDPRDIGMTGGDVATPLGDARAFAYGPDNGGTFGDDLQTAWLPSRGGPPNQWLENSSGKIQWRLYDINGNAAVDIDFGHDHGFGIPHSHNWDNGVRDKGNAFSLLPY